MQTATQSGGSSGQQPKSTYLLLGNVSLADTIIGFSIVFGELIGNSMNSNLLCIFQIGMIVCPTMVSIFSVGLIAVDRYFYILHGLYYQRYFNTTRVRIGILIIWMIGKKQTVNVAFNPSYSRIPASNRMGQYPTYIF
ncbi:hypothetical protein MSG28_006832 [Choristoneura fumiferana]|uniref:Uncharacterized protein n=1 Tax=Choristoneura fumiferana TaxID=7141 RepID=A0ACC0JLI1_CHOFU|nr:hypothetical protein MSG28_006832 [Choristoneura fumiferana]